MAVAGSDYECLYADISSNGRVHMEAYGINADLKKILTTAKSVFPPPENLNEDREKEVPYEFLADGAFAMNPFLLKP